jgi:hypothetical protein
VPGRGQLDTIPGRHGQVDRIRVQATLSVPQRSAAGQAIRYSHAEQAE